VLAGARRSSRADLVQVDARAFITSFIRCSAVMSTSGSPDTATWSANFPFSMAPTLSSHPMFSAPSDVAACENWSTRSTTRPRSTRRLHLRHSTTAIETC
jgi:hypothetical protein